MESFFLFLRANWPLSEIAPKSAEQYRESAIRSEEWNIPKQLPIIEWKGTGRWRAPNPDDEAAGSLPHIGTVNKRAEKSFSIVTNPSTAGTQWFFQESLDELILHTLKSMGYLYKLEKRLNWCKDASMSERHSVNNLPARELNRMNKRLCREIISVEKSG